MVPARRCAWWVLLALGWLLSACVQPVWAAPAAAAASGDDKECHPYILTAQMAFDPQPEKSLNGRVAQSYPYPPAQGWKQVNLPHQWEQAGDRMLTAWYRVEWRSDCRNAEGLIEPVALGINAISVAGAVYSNKDLIWSDASLIQPLSASWNMPRWWQLPRSSFNDGINTLWIRVTGMTQQQAGLGQLYIGKPEMVRERYENSLWRQRTAYFVTALLSGSVGCIFLVIFLIHRSERAYGWYALMSLAWVFYLYTILSINSWPFENSLTMTRASIVLFVIYVGCFCQFTWTFGQQHLPRLQKGLWLGVAGLCLLTLLIPSQHLNVTVVVGWMTGFTVFMLNCIQFQWHAWRTREPRHLLLAACWFVFIVVGAHDVFIVLASWRHSESWSSISGPIATIFMAVLLGTQLATQMRRIARFNDELTVAVNDARLELEMALTREHEQRLRHAKAQERLEIAHDLHDGLGASLVRSMAIVEQSAQPLESNRVMSLLKVLRDDLRQVIDHGSSAGATVPDSPVIWLAPLRHRFTNILDDLDMTSEWQVPSYWGVKPTALQCLALTRVLEEALSNVIKHSRAHHVRVVCSLPSPDVLELAVFDDGVGFDVSAVQQAGLSVGVRSMETRSQRLGATFRAESGPDGTVLRVSLPLRSAVEAEKFSLSA